MEMRISCRRCQCVVMLMKSPLRIINVRLNLYAAVALTTLFAFFGFSELNLKVGITPNLVWIVLAVLGVLMCVGIITFFEGED